MNQSGDLQHTGTGAERNFAGGNQPPASAELPGGDAVFISLDPRVIDLWRVGQIITSAILLGILLIPVVLVALNVRGSFKFAMMGWGAMALFRVFMFFWYPTRAYRAWGYRIDGKVLETRKGVLIHVLNLLPLTRLQHVDLHRGPIERYFGLSTLLLHTAGTVQSTLVIPGLAAEEGARLRDQLVAIGGDDAV